MTRSLRTVPPDMLAPELLAALSGVAITSAFMVDGSRSVGIVHP